MSDTPTAPKDERTAPRDRTHFLYLAVITAVLLGIAVGFAFPDFAVDLKPLGDGFVALIKMMISPIIFCTLVLGIGSVRQVASVGKVGGLALGYFLLMSTVALTIGLLVGNFVQPGSGLALDESSRAAAHEQASEGAGSTTDFLLGIIPTTLFPRSRRATFSRSSSSPCSSGSAFRPWANGVSRCSSASVTCSAWSSRSCRW